jgi:hypothetical protein
MNHVRDLEEIGMRNLFALLIVTVLFSSPCALAGERARLAQADIQVISCGLKDGKWKEYPTPGAARADGATNVRPKGDKPCGGETK